MTKEVPTFFKRCIISILIRIESYYHSHIIAENTALPSNSIMPKSSKINIGPSSSSSSSIPRVGTENNSSSSPRPTITISPAYSNSKSNKQHKYVKPRIGALFQARVASASSVLEESAEIVERRSSLSLEAEEIPSVFMPNVAVGKRKRGVGRPPKGGKGRVANKSNSDIVSTLTPSIKNLNVVPRGGVCVHSPTTVSTEEKSTSTSSDQFLTFARSLILQTPGAHNDTSIRGNLLWKDFLENQWNKDFSESSNRSNDKHPSRSRGRKRNLPEGKGIEKEILSTLVDTDEVKKAPTQDGQERALGMEDDEKMLEYLQMKHAGERGKAEFMLLTEICRRRATKTRKNLRKVKKRNEMNAPLSAVLAPLSDSWRRRYERFEPTLIGDFRRVPGFSKYPYYRSGVDTQSALNLHPWSQNDALGMVENLNIKLENDIMNSYNVEKNEELMKTWKDLLKCGQGITESLQRVTSKPMLRNILIVVGKAYSIPKPEDVFGRRDSIAKHISQCMNALLDRVDSSRDALANLSDAVYDEYIEGVELNSLRKTLEHSELKSAVRLEEFDIVREMLEEALRWEAKLVSVGKDDVEIPDSLTGEDLHLPLQSLSSAEDLAFEGRKMSLLPRSLVLLAERIECAHDLRARIKQWSEQDNSDNSDNVKYIASMIKEANRINLGFPELSILSKVHRNAEEWMDRAAVAIRSKISLNELESLVQSGERMPVRLSGPLEKLRSRYDQAFEWVATLKELVACPLERTSESGCDLDTINCAVWLNSMRKSLDDGNEDKAKTLVDLAAQGSRLPVDVMFLQLLQTAIDSRNWSQKAKRWIPCASGNNFKRGKIGDLMDHLKGAHGIHEKIRKLTDGKHQWQLECEKSLQAIVQKAEEWFEKYRPYLEGDNRKVRGRCSISYAALGQIVNEIEIIPANLGNAAIKMNRIYSQAKSWMDENCGLITRCGIEIQNHVVSPTTPLTLDEINNAIECASKDLPIDLEEVKQLKKIAEEAQGWFDHALQIAPKRKVRGNKALEEKHTIDQIVALIDKASKLPMDTTLDVERLRMQLSDTMSWRLDTQIQIREIANLFGTLRKERICYYGSTEQPIENLSSVKKSAIKSGQSRSCEIDEFEAEAIPVSIANLEKVDSKNALSKNGSGAGVYKMVLKLVKSSRTMPVLTVEEEVAENLVKVTSWCKKAAKVIGSPNDVYTEKRLITDLGEMINEGKRLLTETENDAKSMEHAFDDKYLMRDLHHSWSSLVSEDVARLEKLQAQQVIFYSWCEKTRLTLQESGKKIPIEVLKQLADESAIYPPNAETVKKVRKDTNTAISWAKSAAEIIHTNRVITLDEVKAKVDDGNKHNFSCPEYKILRNELKMARGWINKVKRIQLDEGSTQIIEIKKLIKEHGNFIIALPDEVEALQQAICGYCICRRPYDGFMIGCDECGEWYHGPCIGVSEAQAEKVKKFVCVRCHVRKLYNISCNSIASVIRKWGVPKELAKARSIEAGKHQRKVREKRKEIEKWKTELASCTLLYENELTALGQPSEHKELNLQTSQIDSNVISNGINTCLHSCDNAETKTSRNNNVGKMMKARSMLKQCSHRLEDLSQIAMERKSIENEEDKMKTTFQYWCVMLRCFVFAPKTKKAADESRPLICFPCEAHEDLMSESMLKVLRQSEQMGLHKFPDVCTVKNSLLSASWSLFVFNILMRRPEIEKISALVNLSTTIQLPELKTREMLRSMISRAAAWQGKVQKALTPIAGSLEPVNLEILKDLLLQLNAIPIITPEEHMIHFAVTDGGRRHCFCGGFFDGSKMIPCNKCDKLFHLKCIKVNKDTEREIEQWTCHTCANSDLKSPTSKANGKMKGYKFLLKERVDDVFEGDVSPHAPDPLQLWPPLGLANTVEVENALGPVPALNVEHMQTLIPSILVGKDSNDDKKQSSTVSYQAESSFGATQILSQQNISAPYFKSNQLNQIGQTDSCHLHSNGKRINSDPLKASLVNCTANVKHQLPLVNVARDTSMLQSYSTAINGMKRVDSNILSEGLNNHNTLNGKTMSSTVVSEIVSAPTSYR